MRSLNSLTSDQQARWILQKAFDFVQKAGANNTIDYPMIAGDSEHHSFADHHLTIARNRFVLHRGGEQVDVNPERIESVSPALAMLHQPVDSLTAYRDGRLILRMIGGDEIVVEKDTQYESWETHGTGMLANVNMLCSPHEGSPWGG